MLVVNNQDIRLENGDSDAAVGCLDVQHGADGGGDVGHVGQAIGFAGGDVPAHEDKGDVAIALAPCAVVGACFIGAAGIKSRAGNDEYLTAAAGEIAQLDALLEDGRHGVTVDVEDIYGPFNIV